LVGLDVHGTVDPGSWWEESARDVGNCIRAEPVLQNRPSDIATNLHGKRPIRMCPVQLPMRIEFHRDVHSAAQSIQIDMTIRFGVWRAIDRKLSAADG
jgi:hypothetical protein